ncbi:MAG: hypothetical protein WBD63_06775 [Phycisphaerae bacterium]|nr:hypothetical protein [Phycisphaerae bacterium]
MMPGRPTDHRNLDLTQFNLDVVRGRSGGKIIWQPRIGCWLTDKQFAAEPLPDPYKGMTLPEIYRALGCSARPYEFNDCFKSAEDPSVRISRRPLNQTDYEVVVETPAGKQRAVYHQSPTSPWAQPLKWPVADETEMKVAAWREQRRTWTWDHAAYDRLCREWAGLGAPTMCMPRTSVQGLYINEMGVEAAVFALMDWPGACEAYFEALAVSDERLIEVINSCPIESINFGDNVHAGTLSPDLFKKYVLPVYQRRCELLHAAGKFVYAHWDGDCRPLLPFARETALDGIEAITPVPQGDVTLEETKAALGDMFLLDGIPAIFFDQTFSEQTLADCARRCIGLFAPNLVLGISDEISSTGDLERIRLVGRIVDDYNASL